MKLIVYAEGLTPEGHPMMVTGNLDCGSDFKALRYVTVRDATSRLILARISCVPWEPKQESDEEESEE